jgi:hypothetical protein
MLPVKIRTDFEVTLLQDSGEASLSRVDICVTSIELRCQFSTWLTRTVTHVPDLEGAGLRVSGLHKEAAVRISWNRLRACEPILLYIRTAITVRLVAWHSLSLSAGREEMK